MFHFYTPSPQERQKTKGCLMFSEGIEMEHLLKWVKIVKRAPPAGIYLLKVNNRNTRTRCEICSKLTIKTPVVLVSLLLT